jgi:hypothetical protein
MRTPFHISTNDQGEQVRTTAHIAKPASTPKAGLFATVRALLDPQGTRAPARSSVVAILASLCALAAGLLFATSALALTNPERHYELVSPVYKGGFRVEPANLLSRAMSPDGEALAFSSFGVFAGAPGPAGTLLDYVARRGASGWVTAPIMPPESVTANIEDVDLSPSLDTVFAKGQPGPAYGLELKEQIFALHSTAAADTPVNWRVIGALKSAAAGEFQAGYLAASSDFCHVLFRTEAPLTPGAPPIGRGERQTYELDRGCGGEAASLALLGLNNKGNLISAKCQQGIGSEVYNGSGADTGFNAVSADGGEVFFTTCTAGAGNQAPHQLFVRLGGSRTVEVSRPLAPACEAGGVAGEVPCDGASERPNAQFQGASEDGSKVFFTTEAPLTSGDTDTSEDLYLANIGCPSTKPGCGVAEREVTSVRQVSHDPGGQAAEVQGVVRVSPDGSRVYFVAHGELLTLVQRAALEAEGRPVPHVGADNLYVYDSATETTAFVAELCSAIGHSASVEDSRCPTANSDEFLWLKREAQAQTAGVDSRFLVFATYAQLTPSDTNVAKDVYRYDAVSGRIDRVSLGERGFDDNGNRTVLGAGGEVLGAEITPSKVSGKQFVSEEHQMATRAVSEDGSRIVFTSAEPLSEAAANGLDNAYEWHESSGPAEGSVSLISSGVSTEPVPSVLISPNGVSVFFATTDGLVPQDTDGLFDWYDARLGVGFPTPPGERRPCEGDACQGPLTNPAPLLVPGSVAQAPGGNFPVTSAPSTATKRTTRPSGCRKGYRKRRNRCVRTHRARRTSRRRGK